MFVNPKKGFCGFLLIGLIFTCASLASIANSETTHSIYGLKDQSELAAFEAKYDSISYFDTRHYKTCLQKSISGGLCLSPDQLRYPDGTLASFRDINWLIGTYGVSTDSATVVLGGSKESKLMVAAVLYLLGIKAVAIWQPDFTSILSTKGSESGRPRGMLRNEYFSGPMRDENIALDSDLYRIFELAENISIQKLVSTEFTGHMISTQSHSAIVTGISPSAALVNFGDQILTQTNGQLRVHTNGLGNRTFSDFGYVEPINFFTPIIAALSLLSVGVLGYWWKMS